jgi:hypothetical protein
MFEFGIREDFCWMDWARVVEINCVALSRIVVELMAMIGVVSGAAVLRLLQPAESALRRLIVIAARGLVVKPVAVRPMPAGLVIASAGLGRMGFSLFDARQTYDFIDAENALVLQVKTYQNNPFNLFNALTLQKVEQQAGTVLLSRRLEAFAHALKTLRAQARRLVRWQLRRKNVESPKFTSTLRPGTPPGHRAKAIAEVDFVLRECHALAFDVLKEDSS